MAGSVNSVQIFVDNSPDWLWGERASPLVKKNNSLFLNFFRERIAICLYQLK